MASRWPADLVLLSFYSCPPPGLLAFNTDASVLLAALLAGVVSIWPLLLRPGLAALLKSMCPSPPLHIFPFELDIEVVLSVLSKADLASGVHGCHAVLGTK